MSITERVEAILKAVSATRNSDKELLIIYMQKAGMSLSKEQIAVFRELPAFETITRVRRELQEQGKYEASEAIQEARYQKYKQVKQNIKHDSPERLLEGQGKIVLPWGQ